VAAHHAGLSIRQTAAATGLSRSRIHQLLQGDEAQESPTWLSQLCAHDDTAASTEHADRPPAHVRMQTRVVEEVEGLRWCLDWLERLARGEQVLVNVRPDTEATTEYVPFAQARGRRVLARIAADFDT